MILPVELVSFVLRTGPHLLSSILFVHEFETLNGVVDGIFHQELLFAFVNNVVSFRRIKRGGKF